MFPENCNRCGLCCTQVVRLSDNDIKKIEKAGKKDFYDKSDGEKTLKRKDGVCIFLSFDDNNLPVCNIYENRPEICSDFPYSKRCSFGSNPMFKVSAEYKKLKEQMEKKTGLKAPKF